MKKLFTISDGRSVFAMEEGKVYELVDWKKKSGYFVMLQVNNYWIINERNVMKASMMSNIRTIKHKSLL